MPDPTYAATGFFDPVFTADVGANGVPAICNICNTESPKIWTDHIGKLHWGQSDVDLDGVGDSCDSCRFIAGPQKDSDGDGLGDICDNCPGTAAPTDPRFNNSISCENGTACPAGGGYNGTGLCMLQNGRHICNGQMDSDFDGIGDACDLCPQISDPTTPCKKDSDCPQVLGEPKNVCLVGFRCSRQPDSDSDGHGDLCDNCPYDKNASSDPIVDQKDFDNDGLGDACDNDKNCDPDSPHPNHPNAKACLHDSDCADPAIYSAAHPTHSQECHRYYTGTPPVLHGFCVGQLDTDHDGTVDTCDNCKTLWNSSQANCNARAEPFNAKVGDACDPTPCVFTSAAPGPLFSASDPEITTVSARPLVLPLKAAIAGDPNTKKSGKLAYVSGVKFGPRFCEVFDKHDSTTCPVSPTDYQLGPNQTHWHKMSTYAHGSSAPTVPEFTFTPVDPTPTINQPDPNVHPNGLPWSPVTAYTGQFDWNLTQDFHDQTAVTGFIWTHVTDVQPVSAPFSSLVPLENGYVWSNYGTEFDSGAGGNGSGPGNGQCYGKSNPFGTCMYTLPFLSRVQNEMAPHIIPSEPDTPFLVLNETPPPAGQPPIFIRTVGRDYDPTLFMTPDALSAMLDVNAVWIDAAEPVAADGGGATIPRVAISADGSGVRHVLQSNNGTLGVLGRGVIVDAAAQAISLVSSSPSPRRGFGSALSGTQESLMVVGGADLTDGSFPGDLWRYDVRETTWTRLQVSGLSVAPREIWASTYREFDRSMLVLEHGVHARKVRLLGITHGTAEAIVLGRLVLGGAVDGVFMSVGVDGEIIVVTTSSLSNRYLISNRCADPILAPTCGRAIPCAWENTEPRPSGAPKSVRGERAA